MLAVDTIARSAADPPESNIPVKREVFHGEEQNEITVPLDLIIRGTDVDLYEEILNKNLFRVFLRGKKLVLQAGGFLGLIPINERVSIEVRPRVPIKNLERLLLLTPAYTPEILRRHVRDFGITEIVIPSLIDLFATRLLDSIALIRAEGLHYEYVERKHFGSTPYGRIRPFDSIRSQIQTGRHLALAFSAFERSFDTGPNRCLRLAVKRLLHLYQGMRNRKGARTMISQLAIADAHLTTVTVDSSARFLSDPTVKNPSKLPSSKSSYSLALPIAKLILQNQGVAVRSHAKDISMASVLVNMEDVFEGYLRAVFATHLASSEMSVLDGNLGEPSGAARPLFTDTILPPKANKATPDIVIRKLKPVQSNELIVEVKYKPVKLPDRDDINQVLVYALSYGCSRVALAYPRRSASEKYTERIGTVSGIQVFKIAIDLGSQDLPTEESRAAEAVRLLLK